MSVLGLGWKPVTSRSFVPERALCGVTADPRTDQAPVETRSPRILTRLLDFFLLLPLLPTLPLKLHSNLQPASMPSQCPAGTVLAQHTPIRESCSRCNTPANPSPRYTARTCRIPHCRRACPAQVFRTPSSRTAPPPQFSDSGFPKGMPSAAAPSGLDARSTSQLRCPNRACRVGSYCGRFLSVPASQSPRGEPVSELNPKCPLVSSLALPSSPFGPAFYARARWTSGSPPLRSGACLLGRRRGADGRRRAPVTVTVGDRPFL